jgi:hypothetical protein
MTARSPSDTKADGTRQTRQLLHLVFGGELKSLDGVEFSDISALDIVGIFPNYAEAYKAWKAAAQKTVDNALMRYFIVHMHRLLDPELTGPPNRDTLAQEGGALQAAAGSPGTARLLSKILQRNELHRPQEGLWTTRRDPRPSGRASPA